MTNSIFALGKIKCYLKIIINEMQIKNQITNLFLRKWRNSIHLDKIGKLYYQKLQFLRQILKNVKCNGGSAPLHPASFASHHSVIHPHQTHLAPPLRNGLVAEV